MEDEEESHLLFGSNRINPKMFNPGNFRNIIFGRRARRKPCTRCSLYRTSNGNKKNMSDSKSLKSSIVDNFMSKFIPDKNLAGNLFTGDMDAILFRSLQPKTTSESTNNTELKKALSMLIDDAVSAIKDECSDYISVIEEVFQNENGTVLSTMRLIFARFKNLITAFLNTYFTITEEKHSASTTKTISEPSLESLTSLIEDINDYIAQCTLSEMDKKLDVINSIIVNFYNNVYAQLVEKYAGSEQNSVYSDGGVYEKTLATLRQFDADMLGEMYNLIEVGVRDIKEAIDLILAKTDGKSNIDEQFKNTYINEISLRIAEMRESLKELLSDAMNCENEAILQITKDFDNDFSAKLSEICHVLSNIMEDETVNNYECPFDFKRKSNTRESSRKLNCSSSSKSATGYNNANVSN